MEPENETKPGYHDVNVQRVWFRHGVACPDPTHKEKALLLWVGSGHETKLAEARLTRCGVQEARSLDKMPPKMRACRFRCVSLLHEAACAF